MAKLKKDEFVKRANFRHGNKYIYDDVIYINAHTKITIICPKHGPFDQTPNSHTSVQGSGCSVCAKEKAIPYMKNPTISKDITAVWRTIPRFSKYDASSNGEIRNKITKHIYSSKPNYTGYVNVYIENDNSIRQTMKVHQLVAMTFIDNPENLKTVNHINHIRNDNRVENLEWASIRYQNMHKRRTPIEKKRLLSARSVVRKDIISGKTLETYETIRDASKWVFDNGLTKVKTFNNGNNIKTKISAVCLGRYCFSRNKNQQHVRKSAFGYSWSYTDVKTIIDEEWRPIPPEMINGLKNYYISNKGRLKNGKGRISNGGIDTRGYSCVRISKFQYQLHRIVAIIFIVNPNNYPYVNHKNGCKTDNFVENLEWISPSGNVKHAHKLNLHPNTRSVMNIEKGLKFYSCTEAARWVHQHTFFSKATGSNISVACKRDNNKIYGFSWRYV